MQYHSGGVVLGIAPASPTSWDLGPLRFGVGGTLNSMKEEEVPVVTVSHNGTQYLDSNRTVTVGTS